MTDEKKKDKKDGKEAKKVDDEQLKDVAGGTRELLTVEQEAKMVGLNILD